MGVLFRSLILTTITGTLVLAGIAQAQMYRWTDEQGRVHYSDSPPPEAARQERRVLDDRGLTVRTIERALTAEEVQEIEQREAEEEERRRVREEQERRDRILLQSFGSERELIAARDSRVGLVDGTLSITNDKIRNLEEQLAQLQRRRQAMDAHDREPSEGFLEDMASVERQLNVQRRYRDERLAERNRIIEQFDADLERLRELKAAR